MHASVLLTHYNLGRGITSNPQISLQSPSFGSNPPTFTLAGDTSGGPPTTYTWTRNGEVITDGGPYSISIAVNGDSTTVYQQSRYRSTLTVTGTQPGLYEYSVTNRATTTPRTSSFNIEGVNPLNIPWHLFDTILYVGAPQPTNLMAIQNGLNTVHVSWTAPSGGRYLVTADPGGVSEDTLLLSLTITLQTGVHNIMVTTISQHYPGGTAGPVEVTVRGE